MHERPFSDDNLIRQIMERAEAKANGTFVARDFSTPETTWAWLRFQSQTSRKGAAFIPNSPRSSSPDRAQIMPQGLAPDEFWYMNLIIGPNERLDLESLQEAAWYKISALEELKVEGVIQNFDIGKAVYLSSSPEKARQLVAIFITAPLEQKREIERQIQQTEEKLRALARKK